LDQHIQAVLPSELLINRGWKKTQGSTIVVTGATNMI